MRVFSAKSSWLVLVWVSAVLLSGLSSQAYSKEPTWIDVRSQAEWEQGHLEQAHLIPVGEIGERIGSVTKDKSDPIYLYCRSGRRAGVAKDTLQAMGYTHVTNVGGYEDAKALLEEGKEPEKK